LFQKLLKNDSKSYDLKASLTEEYGFTSLKLIQLFVAIERKFVLEIDNAELDLASYENIDAIIDVVVKYLEGK
jgi:acyl carrier protein